LGKEITMSALLIILIPVIALAVWAGRVDMKRRRAASTGHDPYSLACRAREDAEGRGAVSYGEPS
jgi:hypothetical protein